MSVPIAACKSVPSSPCAATQNIDTVEAFESFEVLSSTNITELTVDEAFEVDVDWDHIRGVANSEPVHFFWGENWHVAEGKGLGGIEDATDNEPKEKGDWGEDRPVAVAGDSMYIYVSTNPELRKFLDEKIANVFGRRFRSIFLDREFVEASRGMRQVQPDETQRLQQCHAR
eukprot:g4874.t1